METWRHQTRCACDDIYVCVSKVFFCLLLLQTNSSNSFELCFEGTPRESRRGPGPAISTNIPCHHQSNPSAAAAESVCQTEQSHRPNICRRRKPPGRRKTIPFLTLSSISISISISMRKLFLFSFVRR